MKIKIQYAIAIILSISISVISGCKSIKKENNISDDVQSVSSSPEKLVKLFSGNQFGFINLSGQIVIKPQFEYVSDFYEGIAIARTKENKYGFINRKGEWIVPPVYDGVREFNEGLAAVYLSDKGWGFIDLAGNVIVKPIYNEVRNYCNGMAAVCVLGKQDSDPCYYWGFIDKAGGVAVRPQYIGVNDISKDGTAVVRKIPENNLDITIAAVIDKYGNIIIPFNFSMISDPWNGIRVASPIRNTGELKTGLLDSNGKWLLEPVYHVIGNIKDGLVEATIIREGRGYGGILKMDGTWLLEPVHNIVHSFQNNMIVFGDIYKHNSGNDPETTIMSLYDLKGNQLLGGKTFNRIDILTDKLVLCGEYIDSDSPMNTQVYYTDGSLVVPDDTVTSAYSLENGQTVACIGELRNGASWGIPDFVGGWLVQPQYYKILTFNGNRGAGIKITKHDKANDIIIFVTEIFNRNGGIIYVSPEAHMNYDDFTKAYK
jgi:hypothetical protein